MAWPYYAKVLTGAWDLDYFKGGFHFEARCVDANNYYDRTDLYPGWGCLTDMDCASKKCKDGVCVGRLVDESCTAHKDCVSGLYCDINRASETVPATCKAMKVYQGACTWDYECSAGTFCASGTYCEKLWYKEDDSIPKDSRQCTSGLSFDDRTKGLRCASTLKFKYGPLVNQITNRVIWYDVLGYNQCGYGNKGYNDAFRCASLFTENPLYPGNSELTGFDSPFYTADYMLTGQSEVTNC